MQKNNKEKALIGFKKAHSLLAKIIDMTEKNVYCMDIMQQNLAVIGLLRSAHEMLMENHLKNCFASAMTPLQQIVSLRGFNVRSEVHLAQLSERSVLCCIDDGLHARADPGREQRDLFFREIDVD